MIINRDPHKLYCDYMIKKTNSYCSNAKKKDSDNKETWLYKTRLTK